MPYLREFDKYDECKETGLHMSVIIQHMVNQGFICTGTHKMTNGDTVLEFSRVKRYAHSCEH